ncbi:hypothetical protein GM921_07970 [Pedobacter sp. LMG 31464]|uniref:Uncharacterized protein n=1 Tax=Pedobacter planticolens TaxID=2679964 RepID=A0A923DWR5_9SPHI|nr:hypothetical protein [Pedobacter planticolens]MBB2145416.1 hypothetical protein [Pedobacter planticolens]
MKYIKGCLITLIIFVGICAAAWFLFRRNTKENLEILSKKVEQNWGKYVENIRERNTELAKQETKSDSLKYYLESSKKFSYSTEYSNKIELNEYKLNKILMSDSLKSNLNDKLNLSLDNYDQSVKEYNIYRVTFPNSIIARKSKFRRNYKYFVVRYGIENEKAMIRKKEMENWVKNGGAMPK